MMRSPVCFGVNAGDQFDPTKAVVTGSRKKDVRRCLPAAEIRFTPSDCTEGAHVLRGRMVVHMETFSTGGR
jgi:hypothetical protein